MTSNQKQYAGFLFILFGILFYISYENSFFALVQRDTQTNVPEKINPVPSVLKQPKGKFEYIVITEGCNFDSLGLCISARSGPGEKYEKVYELETGMIFKIKSKEEKKGQIWYHVHFDEQLRYPERTVKDWYIPAVAGRVVSDDGEQVLSSSTPTTSKRIIVDLSDHMIYAYDGDKLFMTTKVATGVRDAPTPLGTFTIYKKTPSRYMQGPLPGVTDTPFDLPGVPWNMYFTKDGAVIHGAYWHDRYGTNQSNGCINLPPELAKILYDWAPLGTVVTIQN